MGIAVVYRSVVTLFLMMAVGFYSRRKNIINEEINKGLVNILIQIALPCMIFTSFLNVPGSGVKDNVMRTVYYSLGAYVLMGVLSRALLWPVKRDKKTILHFANVFVNTGYVGFPILDALYGPEGIVYGSIFNTFFMLLVWTYGVILFKGRLRGRELLLELKNALMNPSIAAVGLGLLLMFTGIEVPDVVLATTRGIGNLTIPLSMLVIGSTLSTVKLKTYWREWTVYYGALIKLIAIPLAVYLAFSRIETSSVAAKTVLIMSALPASAMTSILADAFDKEKEYAALVVSVTTLLSLFTVTFFVGYFL